MSIVKIPSSLRIGGHLYKISFNTEIAEDGDSGLTEFRNLKIKINPNRNDSRKTTTFLHECLHIIDFIYNARQLEENEIWVIAEGLTQLFNELSIEFDWSIIEQDFSKIKNGG